MIQDVDALSKEVLSGNRRALAQAITLIESRRSDHRDLAMKLLSLIMPHSGNSIRLAISGAPGVGKSTFIDALGTHVINEGYKVAVLTVDPSSAVTGGSILGDKTRMDGLAQLKEAFIRPSPSGNTLGGVTRRSRETILLCEAAGYDEVMIETVGVGQSETQVSEMTDMFLLLLLPGAGDELQGIKRGIMELADLILINKADDEMLAMAGRAQTEYSNALRLLHSPRMPDWQVDVMTCSARDGNGLAEAWQTVLRHHKMLKNTNQLNKLRTAQARDWFWSEVNDSLIDAVHDDERASAQIPILEQAIRDGKLPPTEAAKQLVELFVKSE